MDILILGGSRFTGPHIVDFAQQRGHHVTLFNRGKSEPWRPIDAPTLQGDRRDGDLSALAGDVHWDVVIDMCGFIPREIGRVFDVLGDRFNHYLFVSSLAVYADFSHAGMAEDAPLAVLDDPTLEEVTPASYGPLKVACEELILRRHAARSAILRAGLIVGPGDHTDRFTYWPARVDRCGTVLAPGTPDDPLQVIDARDLARWMIHLAETQTSGVFNAVASPSTMGALIDACLEFGASDPTIEWVDADTLERLNLQPWADLPAWVPARGEYAGFAQRSNQRALAVGLKTTSLQDTVRDTLAWWRSLDAERRVLRAGLSPERERAVLAELSTSPSED